MLNLNEYSQRRYNPLTREWILVSPHRARRPWQGQVEATPSDERPHYDPTCYLCPGNTRANSVQNPAYEHTFVFDNDFPALLTDIPHETHAPHPLVYAESERGICRVVCFSPRHDLTLAQMSIPDIRRVIDVWVEQYLELGDKPNIGYVQIFENRGAMMGASNPHPHGQIWASEHLPQEIIVENVSQREYFEGYGRSLLSDYVELEQKLDERIIFKNESFVVLVPFWAIWPFETLLISRQHITAISGLDNAQRNDLAEALHNITVRYDNLFDVSFPYSMGFHQSPSLEGDFRHWHLHAHFYPPLLRSSTVRKFMVGYEMLGTPQRDITPEQAAVRLREMSDVHYLLRGK
jgi:UDPglucose--hexose-1-phosphate uridylyltransferase